MLFAKGAQRQSFDVQEASLWYELVITSPKGVSRVERYTERAAMLRRQHELLTAWKAQGWRELEPEPNAYGIRAWLEWAVATADPRPRDFALKSLDRVWETCHEPNFGVMRRGAFGEPLHVPQLIDQVELGRTFLYAYQIAGRPQDLARARELATCVARMFEDREKGGFRTQAQPKKDGTIKKAARVPQENARTALFLIELGHATRDATCFEAVGRIWAAFAEDFEKKLAKDGLDAADWALALHAVVAPERPTAPEWQAIAIDEPAPRPKSFRIKVR
jgi:uncharacterized protein YyaL (SSP411 family)